jgi:transmembrane sensor
MDYRNYSAEDLALDEKFQKWVLDPDVEIKEFWEGWLLQNPKSNEVVNEAIELIRLSGLSPDRAMNEAYLSGWKNIHEHVSKTETAFHARRWQYGKIAAAIVFLIVSGFLLWSRFGANQRLEYATAYGEIKEFVLEDGSKVTLNSNSLLTLTSGWDTQAVREVTLEGEAFFEVVKTADRKGFEVATNADVRISVLGTKFNVNTRHEHVRVYLQSGKVKVNSTVGDATLNPGDFVVYKNGDTALKVDRNVAESSQLLSWKEQVFIFNDTPLSEVIDELEDNYGFKVTLQNKILAEKRITAKIPRKDVDVLLSVLSETLDIKIERNGAQLMLK